MKFGFVVLAVLFAGCTSADKEYWREHIVDATAPRKIESTGVLVAGGASMNPQDVVQTALVTH